MSSDCLRPQQPEKELKIKLITKETERAEDARAFAAHLQRKDRKQEDRVGRKAGSTIVKLNELLLSIARGVCASVNRQAEHYAPFERPAVEEAGPFYLRVVEHPMDLHTIIQKAKGGAVPGTSASEQGHGYADGTRLARPACKCSPRRPDADGPRPTRPACTCSPRRPPPLPHRYRRSAAFLADVRLIHANCVKFNQANHNKYARLPPLAEQLVAEIEAELRKHTARLREFDAWLDQIMTSDCQ
jgi:hypothetical protein